MAVGGKLGPKALIGEAANMNAPGGIVAKRFSLGNRVWELQRLQELLQHLAAVGNPDGGGPVCTKRFFDAFVFQRRGDWL